MTVTEIGEKNTPPPGIRFVNEVELKPEELKKSMLILAGSLPPKMREEMVKAIEKQFSPQS